MPELCRFYGILILMRFRDHPPPHLHVEYGSFKAQIDINTAKVMEGNLPPRQRRLVRKWIVLHQKELQNAWNLAHLGKNPGKVAPLP